MINVQYNGDKILLNLDESCNREGAREYLYYISTCIHELRSAGKVTSAQIKEK